MLKNFNAIYGDRKVYGVDFTHGAGTRLVAASMVHGRAVCKEVGSAPDGADTAFGLPPRLSLIRRLASPFKSSRKTRRILSALLDIQMPFSLEECSVAFTQLRTDQGGQGSALACAVRKQDLRQFIADSQSITGVDPVYVDVEGIALWEESIRLEAPVSNVSRIAVLKIEKESSSLVLGSGRDIISAHSLSSFDPAYLKRLLVAAFGAPAAVDWRICGGMASDGPADKAIEGLGPEWKGRMIIHQDPSLFLARALAFRVLRGGADMINLRQGEDTHKGIEAAAERKLGALALVLTGCGLLLAALTFGAGLMMDVRIRGLEEDFTERAVRIAGGNLGGAKGFDAVDRAEKAVAKKLVQARPILGPFEDSPAELLREAAKKAAELNLLIESASISSDSIMIEGRSESWAAAEPLKALIVARGFKVELERQESLVDESVRFKIATRDRVNK